MRRTPVARWICRIVPAAIAAAFATGLPCTAEARMGGGGLGLGGGGFGLGGFRGGGLGRGGVVVVPRGAVGVVGAAQRGAIGVFGAAQRDALGFRNGGVVVLRGGHGFPHGDVFAFGGGHGFPHGDGYSFRYGRVGGPPLLGTSVPPLASVVVPRSGGFAGPRLVSSGVGAAEAWRWDGRAWHLDPTPPQSVAVWRRGDDGRWRAEAAE